MTTIIDVLNYNKKEEASIRKQNMYARQQIKKIKEPWAIKEYKQVIKNNNDRLLEIKRHNAKLKLLDRKSK